MLYNCWEILCQLAPWLLLGMLLSGIMHVCLPEGFIRRRFHGLWGIFQSVAFGIPLPLCSCGVVPAGVGLKNEGASDGAAVGFLISTPQTGIDSILVSASFFGWPFAIFKMFSAGIMGIVGGIWADRIAHDEYEEHKSRSDEHHLSTRKAPIVFRIVAHSIEILRSIWVWLLIGIVASAMIQHWVPQDWFETIGDMGLLASMILVLAVSVPLYVCATASVPIAAAMVASGLPPAAALVFLMAGPATNTTTIGAIYGRFGWKTLVVYLVTIIGGSMLLAWMFDSLLSSELLASQTHHHHGQDWWGIVGGVVIAGLMLFFTFESIHHRIRNRSTSDSSSGIEYEVSGMTCNGCVAKLEKALVKNEQIEAAKVQLNPPRVIVVGTVKPEVVQQIAADSGFQASPTVQPN